MRIRIIKLISIALCAVIGFGTYFAGALSLVAAADTEYNVGDTVECGSYPSSMVTDNVLKASLESTQKEFISYGYYSGDATVGSAAPGDLMEYADFIFQGEKYRAVRINEYRPRQSYRTAEAKNSLIDENGFNVDCTYYFKYEPISWIILDPESGLAVSEKLIDSQPYSEFMYQKGNDINGTAFWLDEEGTVKANDYIKTSLYSFLNEEFFTIAFNSDERSQISTAHLVNNSLNGAYQMYSSSPSDDRVFLLSYEEAENTEYGFTDSPVSSETRIAAGTDYAKAMGLQVDETGTSPWWLRSAGNTSRNASFVNYSGFIGTGSIEYTDKGIRPAVILTSILPHNSYTVTFDYNGGSGEETSRVVNYGEEIGELPSASGDDSVFDGWFTLREGGIKVTSEDIIKADITLFAQWSKCEHSYSVTDSKESTCKEAGYNTYSCSLCGKSYTEITAMKDHNVITDPAVDPTCNKPGLTEGSHCSECGTVLIAQQRIEPDSSKHIDCDNNGQCDACEEIIDQSKYDEYIRQKQAAEAAYKIRVKIIDPSVTAVNYGHTLVLHAELSGTIPEGYRIKWEYTGNGFERTESKNEYRIKSTENGNAKVTLKLVGPDGNIVKNSSGKDISDTKEITSKAGFFQKIIYFFKNLFKINMIIDE